MQTVYALKLEDDCYYVGITTNLENRFKQHMNGTGSKWTKLHPPLEIIYSVEADWQYEHILTLDYVSKYGKDKVRGGFYKEPEYKDPDRIINAMGRCFIAKEIKYNQIPEDIRKYRVGWASNPPPKIENKDPVLEELEQAYGAGCVIKL